MLYVQILANDIDGNAFASMVTYFRYRAHVQDIGWMSWVNEDQVAGTTGQHKRIEALQIRAYLIKQ